MGSFYRTGPEVWATLEFMPIPCIMRFQLRQFPLAGYPKYSLDSTNAIVEIKPPNMRKNISITDNLIKQ